MFIDKDNKQKSLEESGDNNSINPENVAEGKRYLYIGFIAFCLMLLVIIGFVLGLFVWKNLQNKKKQAAEIKETATIATTTPKYGGLPSDISTSSNQNSQGTNYNSDIKAEDLTFGYFYEPETANFSQSVKDYVLPIDVKSDVANYYTIARKLNLDSYVNNLNRSGFAIIANDQPKTVTDFYSAFHYLAGKQIPMVITSDLILYYYQNNLKEIYKEIEQTTFFENIWNVNNSLYQSALARYKNRKDKLGLANDPLLEAERLECAYFATALSLLSPTKEQKNIKVESNDQTLFSEEEVQKYYFVLPEFLNDDVAAEVNLVRSAGSGATKSPLLLYLRNYQDFAVPSEYNRSAKLRNYYLALKWLKSLFPLYYQDQSCLKCSLDFDDWKINMIAANLIAEDLASSQDLKNQWAIIYKFIAFFTGLRQDLTYLNYQQAFAKTFSSGKKVEDVFAAPVTEEKYKALQTELANYSFTDAEGGLVRDDSNKPIIGLRLLQEPYWPNSHIFSRMSGADMTVDNGVVNKETTACKVGFANSARCIGFSYDIANLISVAPLNPSNKYYTNNIDYANYDSHLQSLKQEIDKFNVNTWNSNVFWITLGLGKLVINYSPDQFPAFARSQTWQETKNINTVLGAWANINLPSDIIADYHGENNKILMPADECGALSYIEPNPRLVSEIIAKNKMLIKMLNALGITKKSNIASVELINLNDNFAKILAISQQELANQSLKPEDCDFINNFVLQYTSTKNKRNFYISQGDKTLTESIDGIKYLGLVYQQGDKLILGLGPIFNFKEN